MRKHVQIFIYFLCLFFSSQLQAQSVGAPTLTAGVDGVLYERGVLDAELIASIIAEKQQEIKSEVAQRFVLNQLECGSFVMWNFARRNVEMLLREKDPDVISKEILRNGAELMLVYGFAEYYLSDLAKKSQEDKLKANEEQFLLEYFRWIDADSKKRLEQFLPLNKQVYDRARAGLAVFDENKNCTYYETLLALVLNGKNEKEVFCVFKKDKEITGISQKSKVDEQEKKDEIDKALKNFNFGDVKSELPALEHLPRPKYINKLINTNETYNEKERIGGCKGYSPNHVLMDLIYDICLNNENVQKLGFFQSTGVGNPAYQSRNKYLILDSQNDEMKVAYDSIAGDIEKNINLLFTYFNTANSVAKSAGDFTKDTTITNLIKNIGQINNIDEEIKSALGYLSSQITSLDMGIDVKLSEDNRKLIQDLVSVLSKQEFDDYELDKLHYYLKNIAIPELILINIETNGKITSFIERIEKLAEYIRDKTLWSMSKEKRSIYQLSNFLQLIEMFNNLDKVETYDYVFKFLVDAGNIMGSNRAKVIINTLASGVDKYMIIDSEKNELRIDIVSFATEVYRRFAQNNHRSPFSVYFSVGLNNGFTTEQLKSAISATSSSIYYASEKVGLKLKLYDFKKRNDLSDFIFDIDKTRTTKRINRKVRRRTSRINRAPLVSNIYSLATVSGLLYQIEALNSEENFNEPFYSAGFGAEFFNSLDFNVTYGVTFKEFNLEKGLINIGFDIKIFEYLSRLSEKRKKANSN